MPHSSKKASASNKAPGYWVIYDTDMGRSRVHAPSSALPHARRYGCSRRHVKICRSVQKRALYERFCIKEHHHMNPAQHLEFRIGCATTVYTSVVIGSAFLIVCGAFLQQTASVWQLLILVFCVWFALLLSPLC